MLLLPALGNARTTASSLMFPVLSVLSATAALGCSSPPNDDIAATAQEIRAGNGKSGETYLGVDLLVTDDSKRGVPCGAGNVEVKFEVSRNGNSGPWSVADERSLQLACNDGSGDLALVADNSGSLVKKLALLKEGVSAVAKHVTESGGSMSLVRVSTEAQVLVPLTKSQAELTAAAESMFVRKGWSALWDGVRMANETLGRARPHPARETHASLASFCASEAKRGILLFTDGRENNSSSQSLWSVDYPGDGIDTTAKDLERLRVDGVTTPIYTVALGSNVDVDVLTTLARKTGGRYLSVDSVEAIPEVLDLVAEYTTTTHRICAELPSHLCGSLDVRVTYTVRAGKTESSATQVQHLEVPCATRTAGRVATILLTLSGIEDTEGTVARLMSNVVNYVSSVDSPRVLFVLDDYHHGEFASETAALHRLLMSAGYATDFMDEPAVGLADSDLAGFDVVWFSNPGYPIDDEATIHTLRKFSAAGGGVVLSGDDMSSVFGSSTPIADLTRLIPIDNGVKYCGKTVNDWKGGRYLVTFEDSEHPVVQGIRGSTLSYGDDIDTASLLEPEVTVLAWATVQGAKGCVSKPVVTVYEPSSASDAPTALASP